MGQVLEQARRAIASVTEQDAIAVLDQEERDRETRRALRQPLGTTRPMPNQCPACHRFVASTSAPCGCGWDPVFGWGQ
jgi:hypothetical protein